MGREDGAEPALSGEANVVEDRLCAKKLYGLWKGDRCPICRSLGGYPPLINPDELKSMKSPVILPP